MRFVKIPLLALALTPVVYYPDTLFPHVFPKTVFIRLAVAFFWIGFAVMLFWRPRLFAGLDIARRLRNPVFLCVSAFLFLAATSTIFAVNPYRAFWGDIERGEGLAGLLYFFGFFAGALALFSERDWKAFFGLTLGAAAVLFADQLYFSLRGSSLFGGLTVTAPGYLAGSLMGNPNFLAAFYIFAVFCASMLLASLPRNNAGKRRIYADKLERGGLALMMALAAAGIFLAGTRGAIFGVFIGAAAALIFLASRRDTPQLERRIAVFVLAAEVLFAGIFAATRHASFWQKIPGFDGIARISAEDPTFRTRLISAGSALHAVNPENEGIGRTLVGWGPENFISAYGKYYDPLFLRYENTWFDRAHNKPLDVLVMNGALGLAAYLAVWFFAFRLILGRQNPLEAAALLFFGVSYFAQNLFTFDTASSYIAFFAFLAYLVSQKTRINTDASRIDANPHESAEVRINPRINRFLPALATLFAIFYAIILAVTIIAFGQSVLWSKALSTRQTETILASFDSWSSPRTFAQYEIRKSVIVKAVGIPDLSHPTFRGIFERSIQLYEEALGREAASPEAFIPIAAAYEFAGDLAAAEKYRLKAVELAPRRQDLMYSLALNYARQGRREEAMRLAEELLRFDPDSPRSKIYYAVISAMTASKSFDEVAELVFGALDGSVRFVAVSQDVSIMRNLFQFYIAAFYRQRNTERFVAAMEAAKRFEARYDPARFLEIHEGIQAFKRSGWSAVQLEE